MIYQSINWNGPFLLETYNFAELPKRPGVYIFTDSESPLKPNPKIPPEDDPAYGEVIQFIRSNPCVMYIGKSNNLFKRLPGYKFKPYLEIKRRPKGTPPRHVADRHRGRALLHAHQYFAYEKLEPPLYLRWALDDNPLHTEKLLIKELLPLTNKTVKI